MINKSKQITYKYLKIGQEVDRWIIGGRTTMASAIVKDINASFVTLLVFGTREEKLPSEEAMFSVKMDDAEFQALYRDAAKELMKSIQNKLQDYEIGYHEMWNSWLTFDPYEMAAYCQEHDMKIIGHCDGIIPKAAMFSGEILDIGVCAEYSDGDKIWCHARSSDMSCMLEDYAELLIGQ